MNSHQDPQLAFDTAKAQFSLPQINNEKILALWRTALPTHKAQITEFLNQEHKHIMSEFVGAENYQAFLASSADTQPWSPEDMDLYYQCRSDTPAIAHVMNVRRSLIIAEMCYTNFDDYQIIRDLQTPEKVSKRVVYQELIMKLDLIIQSKEVINSNNSAEKQIITQLIEVLNFLRVKLNNQQEQPLSNEQKLNIHCQIDAINEFIALIFYCMINNFRIDENADFIKSTLVNLNALNQEIFPWLSYHFNNSLPFDQKLEDKAIQEFLKFHTLLNEESILELIAKLFGTSANVAISDTLKLQRKTWRIFSNKTVPEKLKLIENYRFTSHLSDWVALYICIDIVKESQQHGMEPLFVDTVIKFIFTVKAKRTSLPHSNAYLSSLKKDLINNVNNIKESCPGLYIAVSCDSVNEVKLTAQELDYFPPLAGIFYNRESHSDSLDEDVAINLQPKIIEVISKFDKSRLNSYMATVFEHYDYLADHVEFILSDTACQLALIPEDFPLFALRLHYSEKKLAADIVSVWENFLDQDSIVETDFFSFSDNVKLFSNILSVKDQLLTSEKIAKFPKRYRQLVLALEIYQGLTAKFYTDFLLEYEYDASTQWAKEFSDAIIQAVAYPQNNLTMDFNNIIKFMDLTLNKPGNAFSGNVPFEKQQELLDFYSSKPTQNAIYYTNNLIHKFMFLFVTNQPALNEIEKFKIQLYSPLKLPSICTSWVEFARLKIFPVLPVYASPLRKFNYLAIMSAQIVQPVLTAINITANIAPIQHTLQHTLGIEPDSELMRPFQQLIQQHSLPDPSQHVNFIMKVYFAYCQRQKALTPQDYDRNFIEYYETDSDTHFKKPRVEAFIKLYYSLRTAQSSFFKTDWVARNNIRKLPVAEAYRLIVAHSNKVGSRTQKAWELVRKYSDISANNIFLIKHIYAYGFRNSGFFKKSTALGTTYYTAAAMEDHLQCVNGDRFMQLIGDKNTRLDNVVRSLRS
jgi:hypothetical protein